MRAHFLAFHDFIPKLPCEPSLKLPFWPLSLQGKGRGAFVCTVTQVGGLWRRGKAGVCGLAPGAARTWHASASSTCVQVSAAGAE